MPPQIAARFTMGEGAVLAVLAAECSKKGRCTLTIGHVAALAGVGKTTVRTAIHQAAALGLLKSDEWRLSAFRNAPNTVTILSPEWLVWLRLGSPTGRVQNSGVDAYTSLEPTRRRENRSGPDWRGREPQGLGQCPLIQRTGKVS